MQSDTSGATAQRWVEGVMTLNGKVLRARVTAASLTGVEMGALREQG